MLASRGACLVPVRSRCRCGAPLQTCSARAQQDKEDRDEGPGRADFFANMSAEDKARYEEAAIGLSKEQLLRLQNIFDRHDADKSGEIDVSPLPAGERTRKTRAGWSLICGADEQSI